MKTPAVPALRVVAGTAAAAEVCSHHKSAIAPDMRTEEADLTRKAAAAAAERLAYSIREDALEDEAQLGVLDSKKIIDGYLLRRQAERFAAELGHRTLLQRRHENHSVPG